MPIGRTGCIEAGVQLVIAEHSNSGSYTMSVSGGAIFILFLGVIFAVFCELQAESGFCCCGWCGLFMMM